jgi:hypothetical protein
MYNYSPDVYDGGDNKVYMPTAGAQQLPAGAASNASTWAGNDMDSSQSLSSGESYYNTGAMPGPMGYMMHAEAQQRVDQHPDQRYYVPVPMVQTPFGFMPLQSAGPGSPMSQGSPMGQATPLAMPGMVAAVPNADGSTPTNMMQTVSPTSPTMIMQAAATVNGESGMQMIQPVMVMAPPGMPMPGMPGMPAMMPVPPPGYMFKCGTETSQKEEPASPAGDKKPRLLEELLPGGVRRRATREELGRKVFVGGLNPTTTTEDLRSYFSDFGVVTDACVITDSSSKASRGFGFVEFEEKIPEGLLDQQHIIDQRRCGVREYGHSTSSSS